MIDHRCHCVNALDSLQQITKVMYFIPSESLFQKPRVAVLPVAFAKEL